jgi:hypothetical protein
VDSGERVTKLWWAVPAAGFLVLLLVALLVGGEPEVKPGTTYDAGAHGTRAAYLLLDQLGYPVVRSRRPTGESARWVLFPSPSAADARVLEEWMRRGGVLVLADTDGQFAAGMGLLLHVESDGENEEDQPAEGPDVARLAGGGVFVTWPAGPDGRAWATAGGRPFVTVYPYGRGQLWLLNRPEFLVNRRLGRADNGVLVCRLGEATLDGRAGQLAFDEFFHGLRDRPGVAQLLFRPPALWVSLQGLLLLAVLLWHHGPRFGGLRPAPPARRSAAEFLDALAALLQRKRDYGDAFRTARDGLRHDIEQELGLPAGLPAERLAAEAAARAGIAPDALARLLAAPGLPSGTGPAAFTRSLQELETFRDAILRRRPH